MSFYKVIPKYSLGSLLSFKIFQLTLLSLLFAACSSPPVKEETPKETYRSCIERHEALRKELFLKIPEKFRESLAGYHHVVKYYQSTPSIALMKKDVARLEKEKDVINIIKDPQNKNFDPRFIDNSQGRNRILVSFERHRNYRFGKDQDVTLLRLDYSNPELTYTCPLDKFKDNGTALVCQLKGSITSSQQLEGSALSFNYDFKMRIVPLSKKYFYFEWISSGDRFDKDQPEDQFQLRTLVFIDNEDRFFKSEHPYLDTSGDLNPEECAVLEGV